MLLYEYHIRDKFNSVKEYAANLRDKFHEEVNVPELVRDTQNLRVLYESSIQSVASTTISKGSRFPETASA